MIEQVGVIGAGVMGTGVAQSLAVAGYRVVLIDSSAQAVEQAPELIRRGLRMQLMFAKGSRPDVEQVLARIACTSDYDALSGVDFVIENVTESWAVKREVYPRIDALCAAHVVFAANTSAITITRIAAATRRPDRVLGMHFMNPVPMKPTVEVIRGYHTSEETLARASALLGGMGKKAVIVNDAPGFVSNRVLMLTINEAIFLLHEQVATASDVDEIFRSCFGHKMGPLETGDLIGLDTILLSLEVLYDSLRDPKYRPCPLLTKMVDAGLHGRKAGKGFYSYEVAR